MACTDSIVWIGTTYKTIEDYIEESERLGCCRQIQQVPSWAIPGGSRVFLVHRGNHKRLDRGSIFGYYTLKRIEFIAGQRGPNPIEPLIHQFPWSDKYYKEFERAAQSCRRSANEAACIKNKFPKKLKHDFPREVSMCRIRSRSSFPENDDDDPFIKMVKKIFREVMEEYWKEFLKSLESGDYEIVSTEQSLTEGGRGCSKRRKPGAIYLVDTLATEITDAFHEKLYNWLRNEGPRKYPEANREELIEKLKETESKVIYPEEGIFLFKDAKREVLDNRKTKSGDLVVFSKPYPTFQRSPRAAFRGYLRIDGNKLLEQINMGGRTMIPSIPYCSDSDIKLNKPMTKAQLGIYFATELGLQKAMVNKFFSQLSKLVLDELERNKSITLPGLGRLVLSERKARRGVKFRPTKRINDEIQKFKIK